MKCVLCKKDIKPYEPGTMLHENYEDKTKSGSWHEDCFKQYVEDYKTADEIINEEFNMFEPKLYQDERGLFTEVYNESKDKSVKQVNVSMSNRGVVRGLHYQEPQVTKRVWVLQGKLLEVAFNIHTSEVVTKILTPNSGVFECPKGWAHGNQALEDTIFAYTMDGVYNPDGDKSINPNVIVWPLKPILSDKDRNAPPWQKQN